jgi:hypothetical protein
VHNDPRAHTANTAQPPNIIITVAAKTPRKEAIVYLTYKIIITFPSHIEWTKK